MTQDEIIELARQAGVRDDEHTFEFSQYKYLERFAKLVAEKEREACAKIADEWAVGWPHPSQSIAEWIRKRGQV